MDLSRNVIRPRPLVLAMMAAMCSPSYRWIARMSCIVMMRVAADAVEVLVAARDGYRWMLKDSAPASSRIACLTEALSPWMSDTTAMMDVTATMLPSTVMNDRSLADQMAASAIFADSRMVFITRPGRAAPAL